MGKLFTNEKLFKDFGDLNSLFYCGIKTCSSMYNSEELIVLDQEEKVIWGKFRDMSRRLLPMCSIHGSFLLFTKTSDRENVLTTLQ